MAPTQFSEKQRLFFFKVIYPVHSFTHPSLSFRRLSPTLVTHYAFYHLTFGRCRPC